ncbi:MAG TPA: hypothetical protein VIC08_08710, partial [Cellvibrionaceae bacterium]
MDVTSITRAICSFALVCFLAGCESDQKTVPTQSTTEEQVSGAAQVNNDCQLPAGVVFTDCVSSMWRLPSYYYMPTDGAPGREVLASEPIDHFVQARISEEGP